MNEKLVLLNRATLQSLKEDDRLKIIERFTKTAIKILSADFGFMYWKLKSHKPYQLIYKSPDTPYKPKLPRKRGYNYKASQGRIPYFVDKPKRDLRPYMKSLAIIPIFYRELQYGNIVVCFKKSHFFNDKDHAISMALSNTAAQVLTIHSQHKKAEDDIQKLLRQKDEFFNMASHELKTPVTTIKGFAQLLSAQVGGENGKTKHYLDKINTQVDKLSHLINDLLDISRIETGKLKFEKSDIDLYELTKCVAEDLKVSITDHQIIFKNNYGKFGAHADSERIEQVLINLITNAAKYSAPGTEIIVRILEDGKFARVEVEDFGFGIRKDDKQKVFHPFFQSNDPAKNTFTGLGLGLYISQKIIRHHGGTLDFISKKDTPGTIFYFKLPCIKIKK